MCGENPTSQSHVCSLRHVLIRSAGFVLLVGSVLAANIGHTNDETPHGVVPHNNLSLRQMLEVATGTNSADDVSRSNLHQLLNRTVSPAPGATPRLGLKLLTATSTDEIFWDGFELCGDGVIESPEQCDRSNLGGATCTSLGFTGGTLACDNTCHYDTSQCTGCTAASCTNGCCYGNQCFVGVNCVTCLSFAQPCTLNTDCCSDNCQGGKCQVPAGTCLFAHETCVNNSDCCSNACDVNVDGVSRCSEPNQCKPLGISCTQAADCCSLDCDSGSGLCSSTGTCIVAGAGCTSSTQCCSGNCAGGICTSVAASCSTLGETCSGGSTCCSGACDGGRCDFYSFCRAEGDLCTTGSDCCNGVCNAGRCDTTSQCVPSREPCTGLRSCCDTLCTAVPGLQATACTPISGCLALDDVCTQNTDCCSGSCGPPDAAGLRRCVNVTSCVADGDVCGGLGASQNCCTGGKANCQSTSAGVSRCWPNFGGACSADGVACNFADECCGHSCRPDALSATGFSCASGCLAAGAGTCTYDADCCAGSVCQKGVCQAGGPLCGPVGDVCTTNENCCFSSCTGGTCH